MLKKLMEEVKKMKKMNEKNMKATNGGKRFVCKKCGATFYGSILGKSAAGYHILFNPGHTKFRVYTW
jgi:transposase-like protein